jgi:tetratricopeptide (TPR) repeat protein
MIRFLLFIFPAFLIISCSDEESGSVLNQPPFASLTDSISREPDNDLLLYKRGGLLYKRNEKELAEEDIGKAWQLNPKEEYALSLTTLLKEKNVDSAIVFLQKAIKRLPSSIALQIGLAKAYQEKGMSSEAIDITDNIIKQYPNQIDAIVLKAELLSEKKKDESLLLLEKAYAMSPADLKLAYDLAFEYAQAGNSKALGLTDSIIAAKAPEPEKAYYIKAIYYDNMNQANEALKNYDEAIRQNYNFLDVYRDKGSLLYREKNYDAALRNFQLALKIGPAVAEYYYWIGKIMEAKGNKEEAKFNYKKAYALDKSFIEAKEAEEKLQ